MLNHDLAAAMAGLVSSNRCCTFPKGRAGFWLTSEVFFIEDVARVLGTSRSTIERRRRSGTFPIPELPRIDGRPRWSREAVQDYLKSSNNGMRPRRGRPRRVN